MPGINKQRTFWKKVRSKYKLSFFNENTLEEVWTFRLSRLGAFIVFALLLSAIVGGTYFIIAITPLKTLLPGYVKTETRIKMIDNALRVDSLQRQVRLQESYLEGLRNTLSGNISFDSIQVTDSILIFPVDSLLEKSQAAADFVRKFEEEERYTLTIFTNDIPTEGFVFYSPVKGEIKRRFNVAEKHYGIDILPARNASVAATLDGTVLSADYTIEAGYVIMLQHSNDFISVYKYNSQLLKQVGDKVIGGEKIAIAGTNGEQGEVPLLEFQLWHKGVPLNPEEYVTF